MNSSDIEVIEGKIHNKDKILFNLLTEDDSSDEEIICLDTVFKPSGEMSAASASSTPLPPEANQMNYLGTSNDSRSQVKLKCFDEEEEVIDDIMPIPIAHQENLPGNTSQKSNAQLYHVLYAETNKFMHARQTFPGKHKNDGEPQVKKLKTNATAATSTVKARVSDSSIIPARPYNSLNCNYPLPVGAMLDLIIIILKNTKCLLTRDLWDCISGLFPYYEYHFDETQGVNKTRRVLSKNQSYFLRTSEVYKQSNKKLVMLSPVTKTEQSLIIEKVKSKKAEFITSMYTPEMFDSLIEGNLNLTTVKLFHNRRSVSKRVPNIISLEVTTSSLETTCSFPTESQGTSVGTSVASIVEDLVDESSSSIYMENLKDVNVLDLVDEGERADALSPKSSSSIDTIVFDPKIVNCRTLLEDEVETDLLTVDEEYKSSSGTANETGFQNKLLIQLADMPLNSQGINSDSAFANTVWTNEDSSSSNVVPIDTVDMDQVDPDHQSEAEASFPEMDKCVPKWREIFPWMEWNPWDKKIYCTACQKIHKKLESNTPVVVVEVNHPDDVFKVSKQLRTHSEKTSHKMALILENKAIISTLYFLLNSHFNEFNSIKEILTTFDDLFPSGINFNQDTLKCTIQMLGEYLEDKIISKLKKLKKFSIVTDPCAGLLVVRFVNEDDEPEEHIISSYGRVMDKTPCDYLNSLGVLTKYMIVYVSNARCEECPRCKATKKVGFKNSTPLRLPPMDKYFLFLWRTKLLKPFYSIGSTLCKLWVSFPHKFTEIGKLISLDKLSKFPSNPDAFIDVFQHFEKFQEIAKSIYLLTGNLEALGFQTIEASKYNWILDLFPILTNISILFVEIKGVFPFHKDFDHLFHSAEKLKLFCDKAKENIKEKKIIAPGIDAADLDDLYNLVDLTVKEFQQPIYNKGRSVPLAYYRMTVVRNLEMYKSNANIKNTFVVLYSAIKSNYRYENTTFLLSLTNFLKGNKYCEKKDAVTVLNYFKKNNESLTLTENIAYSFYRVMAYFPFQPAKNERCIYETKIYEYLFYRSAWSGIGPNIKDYLLTIIYELSGKQMLSEKDILTWWRDRVK